MAVSIGADCPSAGEAGRRGANLGGTFHYYCEVHGSPSGGMAGVVEVAPAAIGEPPDPVDHSFRIAWAATERTTGNAFDVRFRVDGGDWQLWQDDTHRIRGRFGKSGSPVAVQVGSEYDFEVRSEDALKHSRRSGWSPPLTVTGN